MLKLYVADVSNVDTDAAAYPLSEYRRVKLERVTRPQLRRQSIGAELLLNYALHNNADSPAQPLRICRDGYGKPYFENSSLCFSLSHSGDYAACAVSDGEVGVDIQKLTRGKTEISQRFFSQDEQLRLREVADPDEEFTRIWSLKESCIKAVGQGLQLPLNSFSVLSAPNVWILGSSWLLSGYKMGDYYLAVCSKEPHDKLEPEIITM